MLSKNKTLVSVLNIVLECLDKLQMDGDKKGKIKQTSVFLYFFLFSSE